MIDIFHNQKAVASFIKDNRNFIIDYKDFDIKNSIALSLPNTQKIYLYDYKFPPFLEGFLPEGYLYEIFKNLLSKEYEKVDDYLIFSLLSSNIQSRIGFKVEGYLDENPGFKIGKMMLDSWKLSLKEETIKELDNDTIRTWKNY